MAKANKLALTCVVLLPAYEGKIVKKTCGYEVIFMIYFSLYIQFQL